MLNNKNYSITFLNHASFFIETEDSLLFVDPWFEGLAFDNGWSLLDDSICNQDIINVINDSSKQIFIWYSHEHSDHLSMSFIHSLKDIKARINIYYQKTLDKRVKNFFLSKNFNFVECYDGRKNVLGEYINLYCWSFSSGDSYCLININDIYILNLNDCVLNDESTALSVLHSYEKITKNIDILFTQFGYASWISNKDKGDIRKKAADEKMDRIAIQNKYLQPSYIIPFASFIYFCHEENFYCNDHQNSPKEVRISSVLKNFQDKIYFLKTLDKLDLEKKENLGNQLNQKTIQAEFHWNSLFSKVKSKKKITSIVSYTYKDLVKEFEDMNNRLSKRFLYLQKFFQLIGVINPINVDVVDLGKTLRLSYFKNPKILDRKQSGIDISVSSEVLRSMFKYEYGANTVAVNSRCQVYGNIKKSFKFFMPQDLYQRGYGANSLRKSFLFLFFLLIKKIKLL